MKNLICKGWLGMDWYKMAVFLYAGALTHFLADLLSHYKKKGAFIFLHCFLYTLFFIPLFWWLRINLWWLFLLFFSHLIIDVWWRKLLSLLRAMVKEYPEVKETSLVMFTTGLDQILHLSILLIIALFTF